MHASTLTRSRQHSREFTMNRRNMIFTEINPLPRYGAELSNEKLAYDGKPTAQSMLDSAPYGIKARHHVADAAV